jgi:hypothetical protein
MALTQGVEVGGGEHAIAVGVEVREHPADFRFAVARKTCATRAVNETN